MATPAELVLTQPDADGRRLACLCRPTAAAVVLGSTQSPAEIDERRRERRGYDLVKRRSGGGAVVVAPSAQVWLDLFVPRDDPLFDDDVGRAGRWVADLWTVTVATSADAGDSVQPIQAYSPSRYSRSVCFSGLGPGEVTVDGRKVVGVSQRRGRAGAWFFTMALCANEQPALADLLVLEDAERGQLAAELVTRVGHAGKSVEVLENAVVSSLFGNELAREDMPAEPHPRQ